MILTILHQMLKCIYLCFVLQMHPLEIAMMLEYGSYHLAAIANFLMEALERLGSLVKWVDQAYAAYGLSHKGWSYANPSFLLNQMQEESTTWVGTGSEVNPHQFIELI